MAAKQLSPVLQTRKINSLPQDLRKIADELLIDKFGEDDVIEKEVKVAKSTDSFREELVSLTKYDDGHGNSFVVPDVRDFYIDPRDRGLGIKSRLDFYSRQRIFTTPVTAPNFRGLTEALRRFDEQNFSQRDRIFRFNTRFWDALRCDREVGLYLSAYSRSQEYTIFGCRIIIDPSQSNELEVRF